MTGDEFIEWLKAHKGYYPSLGAYLGRLNPMDRDRVLAGWRNDLGAVALADAIAASKSLYSAETQPRSYDRHGAEVARRARAAASQRERLRSAARFGGRVTYRCADCLDRGIASVYAWGAERDRAIEVYGAEIGARTVFGVGCDCDAGKQLSGITRLNRRSMRIAGKGDPDEPLNEWPEEIGAASASTEF